MASLDSNIAVTVQLCQEDRDRIDALIEWVQYQSITVPAAPYTFRPPLTPYWHQSPVTC